MHDMAVEFDRIAVGDLDAVRGRHTSDIVAAEVEQHQMFGPFLGIGEQAFPVRLVFGCIFAARTGAGDRPDGDLAIARADQDFRAGTGQRKAGQVEKKQEGRRVDPAQGAIKLDRGQGEGRGETLRQHHLEDVTGLDIIFCAQHHLAIFFGGDLRRKFYFVRAERVETSLSTVCQPSFDMLGTDGGGEPTLRFIQPLPGRSDLGIAVAIGFRPDRRDQKQLVGQPVKNQNHRRSDKQHVGQIELGLRCARKLLDQPDGLIAEIADEAGQRTGQFFRHIHLAGLDQFAQGGETVVAFGSKGLAVVEP